MSNLEFGEWRVTARLNRGDNCRDIPAFVINDVTDPWLAACKAMNIIDAFDKSLVLMTMIGWHEDVYICERSPWREMKLRLHYTKF